MNLTLFWPQDELLVAYQIGFDLVHNASQQFRLEVRKAIADQTETDSEQARIQAYYAELVKKKEEEEAARKQGSTSTASSTEAMQEEKSVDKPPALAAVDKMKAILSGTMSIDLFLEFLHRNNHTDKLVLKNIKAAMESRSSVVYSSIIICHGFAQAGTTNDFFLRDHLEWLSRATNWSKFTATASLGVIQKGHHKESMTILAPYLPQQVGTPPFQLI